MEIKFNVKEDDINTGSIFVSDKEASEVIARFLIKSDSDLIPTALKDSKEGQEEMIKIFADFLYRYDADLDSYWGMDCNLDVDLKAHFWDEAVEELGYREFDRDDFVYEQDEKNNYDL